MDKCIPITKKQSDLIDALHQQKVSVDAQLSVAVSTLIAAFEDDMPQQFQWRTTKDNGVYAFHVTFPDPPELPPE